jgi:magnesium-transporting ATPase (P-type)
MPKMPKMPKVPSAPENFKEKIFGYGFIFALAFAYTILLWILSRMYLDIDVDVDNLSDNDKQLGTVITWISAITCILYFVMVVLTYYYPSKKMNTNCLIFALFLFVIQIFCGLIICSHIINTRKSPKYSNIYNLASGILIYLGIICIIIPLIGFFFLKKKNKIADESSKTSKTSESSEPSEPSEPSKSDD